MERSKLGQNRGVRLSSYGNLTECSQRKGMKKEL